VRGLTRFRHARALFAASLVLGRATARALRELQAEEVCFVITGEWVDRDGDEDIACADYIEALLHGEDPDPEQYAARVRNSDFGRRFQSGTSSQPARRRPRPSARSPIALISPCSPRRWDGQLQLKRTHTGQADSLRHFGELRNGLRLHENGYAERLQA
jgi:hypothetical protein